MTYLQFLIPSFLHRLDNRLMLQLPHIWRTRIHFVAFYAAIAWILLFFIGFLYPLSMFDISRTTYVLNETKGVSSLFLLICGFFALVYWWQQVAKFRIIVAKWYHSCVECVLFALGILLIWQAVNAFKNGLDANIGYRVGRHISAADKAQLYAHNFYLPGGLAYLWGDQFHGVMYRNHYGDPIDSTAFLYFLDAEKLLQKYHSKIKKQGVKTPC